MNYKIIKPQEFLGIIIFFLILVGASLITINKIEKNIKDDVESSLKTVLNTTRIAFHQWKARKESEISIFSRYNRLVDITKRLLKIDRNPEVLINSKEQEEIRGLFAPFLKRFHYAGIFIISKDSISLASMRDANVGTKNFIYDKRPKVMEDVWNGKIRYVPPIASDVPLKSESGEMIHGYPTMFFAAPIFNEINEVIAVFTLRVDVVLDFAGIAELGRIGKSGETYAVDEDGWLITKSRFSDQLEKTGRIKKELLEIGSIKITDPGGNTLNGFRPDIPFDQLPLTLMAADVISGNSNSNMDGYNDYRGVKVFGTWYWDNELGIGVTTEIDVAEAMSTFLVIKYAILVLISVLIIITIILLSGINRIRKKSINQLKEAHDKLEEKVIERTAELKKEQYLMDLLMSTIPDNIYFKDINSRFLKVNKATYEKFGFNSEEQLIGKSDSDLFGDEHSEAALNDEKKIIETGISILNKIEKEDWKNGNLTWVVTSKLPLKDEDNNIVGTFGITRDISEIKKAEEESKANQQKLELVLEASKIATWTWDIKNNLVSGDERLFELFEIPFEKKVALTKFLRKVHPNDFKSARKIFKEAVEKNKYYNFDFRIKRNNGEIVYLNTLGIVSAFENEEPVQLKGVYIDITRRKVAEEEIIKAKAEAEKANKAKSDFLARMSHELRTPLNAILGYTQILERNGGLSTKQQKGLTTIKNSGEHLLELINDILDLSKIEAGKFELSSVLFDIESLLKNLVEIIKVKAEQKDLKFIYNKNCTFPKSVIGDAKAIKQVLINILGNAIKFTEEGTVSLTIEKKLTTYYFHIKDTGIGIPQDKIQTIFEPFKQTGHSGKKEEGTGLGLSITKKIIDLMGGELKVKSILGKGTTFTVVLTLKESENIIASKTEEMKQIIGYRGERKTILIADDNQNNSDILEGMLSPIGFSLIIVDDGEKAVSKTLENKPDLVLMDMIMPNMDGFEAIQKIRANDEFMDLPIIALSASVLKHEQESTLTVGSNDFLAKPFKIESLLDKIQFYLNLEWIYKKMLNEKKEFLKNNVVNNVDEDELPDKQFLETIKNLTLEGDFGGIITKLDELKERGNQYNRFIDRIKKFADDFDEDGIIEFIDGIE